MEATAAGVDQVAILDNPLGRIIDKQVRPNGMELSRVRERAAGLEEDGKGEGVPAAAESAHAAEEAERVARVGEGAQDGVAAEGGGEGGRREVVIEDGERAR